MYSPYLPGSAPLPDRQHAPLTLKQWLGRLPVMLLLGAFAALGSAFYGLLHWSVGVIMFVVCFTAFNWTLIPITKTETRIRMWISKRWKRFTNTG